MKRCYIVSASFEAPELGRRVRHKIVGVRALTAGGARRKVRREGIPCGGKPFTVDAVERWVI